MAADPWQWHPCRLVSGHGVASGRAPDSPYPAGTISLQTPLFAAHGVDLGGYYPGTLNLAFDDTRWRLRDPDARLEQLRWTELHPPETFSFWRVALRWQDLQRPVAGLLYWPHPETKQRHHQPCDRLELLAPWLDGIANRTGLELGVDPRRCLRIRPRLLQARLLEALKFRVLASQEAFFAEWGGAAGLDTARWRRWIGTVLPQACDLEDGELLQVLERARFLYCDGSGCYQSPGRSGLD
ncbi:MAG: hypothetical protein VKM98_01140 [Cyanobacteriota bacterium]|nr:hypothetical protein [Cyanobacteriota bacterium]